MVFPSVMADLYDNMGNTRLSAIYHTRVYDRNPTNENLFFALSAHTISEHSNKETVRLGRKFFIDMDWQERTAILDQADAYLVSKAGGDQITIGFATNNDDRMRRGFIRALLRRGDTQTAREMYFESTTFNFNRPSYAVLEFPRTIEFVDVHEHFLEFHDLFTIAYKDQSNESIRAQFFIDYAMILYNDRFGNV